MALKGILGYDGVTAVMTPDGTKPVLMESPCPYAQWEIDDSATILQNATLTHGSYGGGTFWMRVDASERDNIVALDLRLKMISAGADKSVRATMTYGGGNATTYFFASVETHVGTVSQGIHSMDNNVDYTTTVDAPEPYYRYWMAVVMLTGETTADGPLTWVRVDFEFV